ncbi:MAG: PilZ domain-containing protein [Gammaproteobacteria bacterium]
MTNDKNRRGFFRIYDEVNLFYKKIDEKLLTEPHTLFDIILNHPSLSSDIEMVSHDSELLSLDLEKISLDNKGTGAQIQENETHNVNISASGMAFICEGALNEGDYLIIKIVLVSSKAVIVTYGQVVFCEESQSRSSRYPYFVGVHFVDLKDEYRELLINHVDKKRRQHRWINGLLLASVLMVIVAPNVVFNLSLELLHFLFERFIEFSHIAFEVVELALDRLIEHFFHTNLKNTQLIVFYILLSFVVYGLYWLWRVLPPFCRHSKENLFASYAHKKASLLYFWREQSLFNKIKLVVIGIAAMTLYILFGI